ncbi:MAG: hypothetical protein A3Q59_00185 [Methanomethylophilus alvi]|nr:MAG: hypothetical protein A3Q59_00185 [Methanomethylophilus alvi]WII09678.1 UPF0179 family protein [Methanomassiliicoccales archaeon LGM-DZ1]
MILLTLIGKERAEAGRRFVYIGPEPECSECKVRDICLNLEKGSEYMVRKPRRPVHECALTGEQMQVVEVEKVSREGSVDTKLALEGATVQFKAAACGQTGCPHYLQCNPPGIEDGTKVTIERTEGKADCPVGLNRTFAVLK